MRVIVFRLIIGAILVLAQVCVYLAGRRILQSAGFESLRGRRAAVLARLFFLIVNIPLAVYLIETVVSPRSIIFYSPPPRFEPFIIPVSYAFFVWSIGSILFVVGSPILMGLSAFVQRFSGRRREMNDDTTIQPIDLSRRRFLQLVFAGAAAVPFAASAYGAVTAKIGRAVERVEMPVRNLPRGLDGLRIVQMSDIHCGSFTSEAQIRAWVDQANALNPDIVALTGDFVATRNSEGIPFMSAIHGLRSKYGIFGCLGNHDMYTHAEEFFEDAFQKAGFKLLRNSNQYVEINGERLNVIGVDFIENQPKGDDPTLADVLSTIPLDGPTLLLSHNPNTFPDAARAGIDVTLSGHTHGGQIVLKLGGILITPARIATMFVAGFFKQGSSNLYVNRGLGTTGPPIRINAPPEITLITLIPA